MLTADENKFIAYWKENRERKKKVFRQLSVGLPMGIAITLAIFINVFSGWYTRAFMEYNANKSIFIVLMIAAAGITVFFTIYSAKHRWDLNEQRYIELLKKKERLGSDPDAKSV